MDPWRVSLPICVVRPSNGRPEPRSRAADVWGYAVWFRVSQCRHSGTRRKARARNPYSEPVAMDSGLALRAPRNDEGNFGTPRHSRRTECPSLASNQNPRKSEGAGKAGCTIRTRSLACEIESRKHTSEYRYAETFRPSLRNGFAAYSALSPVSGLIATVARKKIHELDPSVGRSGPHAFAVRSIVARPATPKASIAARTQRP
jgi:hypothetical protein